MTGTTPPVMVMGVDLGGSTTRVAIISVAGQGLSSSQSGPANVTSTPPARLQEAVVTAIGGALGDTPAASIVRVVVGAAGYFPGHPGGYPALDDTFRAAGITCPVDVRVDIDVSFAAGTSANDGALLLSGTGAIAADVRGGRCTRMIDGHGPLLGDRGSGHWLGLRAVGSLLHAIDRRTSLTAFQEAVLAQIRAEDGSAPPAHCEDIIRALTGQPSSVVAALAPIVLSFADDGDSTSTAICHDAAAHLLDSFDALDAARDRPVVLAGGILLHPNPVSNAVTDELRQRGYTDIAMAGDGFAGALWLAVSHVTPNPPVEVRAALFPNETAKDSLL